LHGALSIDEGLKGVMKSNEILDQLGKDLGGPVHDWPAATHSNASSLHATSSKPGAGEPMYLPTIAVLYLIEQINKAKDKVSIRLFGWSTGAIMLCEVARGLRTCPEIDKSQRKVDLCFAIDPLWSLAAINVYPTIPANIARWVCVRQNRDGNKQPTLNPLNPKFWQGVRLRTGSDKTRYDEINVPTGKVVGDPGFSIATDPDVTHGKMPGVARRAAFTLLSA
jgi:hypothetical protein